jgi:hypothetical protein
MRELTLVMDGLKMPEYKYPWAWEDLQNWENVDFTAQDIRLINAINEDHMPTWLPLATANSGWLSVTARGGTHLGQTAEHAASSSKDNRVDTKKRRWRSETLSAVSK